jgi:hypothetical protein
MSTRFEHDAPSAITLLAAILSTAVAPSVSAQISTVLDPVGDTIFPFNAPFQDFVRGQMTKTASGDFELLMEMAVPVPIAPPLPPQGNSEIWWFWIFDLDPTTSPQGFPWRGQGSQGTRTPEFIVYVGWDGTEFAGAAIDRRPLLNGEDAIITPVPFGINGTIVDAVLPYELIGNVPPGFVWGAHTCDWSGPVGSSAFNFADYSESGGVFDPLDPSQPESVQMSEVLDPVGDTSIPAPAFQDIVGAEMTMTTSGGFEMLMELAGSVPGAPILPPPGLNQIWWSWMFDLDPTASPRGYPAPPGVAIIPEFIVYVSWDGTQFAGTAVDRRPLLTGGAATVTPVPFFITGTRVEALLDFTVIGEAPPIFDWRPSTLDWAGPLGAGGWIVVDNADFTEFPGVGCK